jgi:hypothetical protein
MKCFLLLFFFGSYSLMLAQAPDGFPSTLGLMVVETGIRLPGTKFLVQILTDLMEMI